MKKLTCIFLLLTIIFTLTACNQEEKVSLYIPDTITIYAGEDAKPDVIHLLYPKGWEQSESFTVSYSADGKTPIAGGTTIAYVDKHSTTKDGETRLDEYFDEKGQVVSRNVLYERSSQVIQSVFTYDLHGRVRTQTTCTSFIGGKETYLPRVTFQYEETEQGSKGVSEQNGYTETYCYDKEYRLVSYSVTLMGQETNRTEYAYDEHGNTTEIAVYMDNKLSEKRVTAYKVVEVAKATADRMPQFKREN